MRSGIYSSRQYVLQFFEPQYPFGRSTAARSWFHRTVRSGEGHFGQNKRERKFNMSYKSHKVVSSDIKKIENTRLLQGYSVY